MPAANVFQSPWAPALERLTRSVGGGLAAAAERASRLPRTIELMSAMAVFTRASFGVATHRRAPAQRPCHARVTVSLQPRGRERGAVCEARIAAPDEERAAGPDAHRLAPSLQRRLRKRRPAFGPRVVREPVGRDHARV